VTLKTACYALLWALCALSALQSESTYKLTETQRQAIFVALQTLETNLTDLRQRLSDSQAQTARLGQDLQTLQVSLSELEQQLLQAKDALAQSDANLTTLKQSLTSASQRLTESEQSFRDYQRGELFRQIGYGAVGLGVGVIIGGIIVLLM
jgi:peptidoglycan hydrolase CwlO-like protein